MGLGVELPKLCRNPLSFLSPTSRLPIHFRTAVTDSARLIMNGLISARFNPTRPSYVVRRFNLFPSSTLPLKSDFCKFPLAIKEKCKALSLVTNAAHAPNATAPVHFSSALPTKEVLEIWRKAEAVCLDVDSTVCLDEGIDELADFCGAGKAVAEWTARAMNGSVPFEEALAARLSLFSPSLSQVQDFLDKRPPKISPGIHELIRKLKANKTDVYLVSGGFRQMIEPVALQLDIPLENIFANQLLFGSSGEYCGFDKNEPTSRSEGKATAVQTVRKTHGYKSLVMIGDGATDLEARKPGGADLFICYAGVQLREAVAAKADWLVFRFEDLINSFEIVSH